jgi:hypothetical protein
MRDYYIVFLSLCTTTYNREAHESTLRNIDRHFWAGYGFHCNCEMLGERGNARHRVGEDLGSAERLSAEPRLNDTVCR